MSLSAYFGSLSVANLLSRMPAAAAQGMIWGLMALGVFITFRVLDIADLTVDGSFATGGAVTVMLLLAGWPSWAALLAAFAAGVLTGLVTGLLHTKLGIPAILAGILTQFSLYSINLRIMTKANQTASIKKFGMFWEGPKGFLLSSLYVPQAIAVGFVLAVVAIGLLYWYFGTEQGSAMRATGSNPAMSRAQGIHIETMKVIGLGLSNGMVALAGVWPVDEGTIEIGGVDVTAMPEYKRAQYIGRVFQDPMMGTAPNMQIEENLALAYRRGKKRTLRWGVTQAERKLFRDQLATLGLGLEDRMTAKVGLLSGGQRQALTLLMAALQTPKLLLLDEHTAALDPATAAKVLEISDKIVRDGKLTALMITHNMTDAIRHGNRLIMMDQGRIVLDISGEDKQKLTKADLLARFAQTTGTQEETDSVLLS